MHLICHKSISVEEFEAVLHYKLQLINDYQNNPLLSYVYNYFSDPSLNYASPVVFDLSIHDFIALKYGIEVEDMLKFQSQNSIS